MSIDARLRRLEQSCGNGRKAPLGHYTQVAFHWMMAVVNDDPEEERILAARLAELEREFPELACDVHVNNDVEQFLNELGFRSGNE